MGKRILRSTILLTWLAMVGWQVGREYFQPELGPGDPFLHAYDGRS